MKRKWRKKAAAHRQWEQVCIVLGRLPDTGLPKLPRQLGCSYKEETTGWERGIVQTLVASCQSGTKTLWMDIISTSCLFTTTFLKQCYFCTGEFLEGWRECDPKLLTLHLEISMVGQKEQKGPPGMASGTQSMLMVTESGPKQAVKYWRAH